MTNDQNFETNLLWEKAKTIYLSSLLSQEDKSQVERYFSMISSVKRDGNTITIITSNQYAADYLKTNYSDRLKKCLELISPEAAIELTFDYQKTAPIQIQPARRMESSFSEPVRRSTFVSTIPLNEDYTFSNFVSGASNSFAIAAAKAVVSNPGRVGYNPLFIHGGTGLGKTHLMQAIGNELKLNRPEMAICYLTAEEYLNEYINYMKEGNIHKFREIYRSVDILLIDDVQFFQKGKEIQEEFFNNFNALKDSKKQIVMTSDVAPKNLPASIEVRLISRFEGGMLHEIESPNYETRLAILKKKTENSDVNIPDFALEYIADNIKSHVRAMEGALATVEVFLSANKDLILDKNILNQILDDFIKKEVTYRKLTIEEIQKACAEQYGISIEDILSHERTQTLVTPRQLAMYISRKYTSKGLQEIASVFDKKHATIINGVKTIQQRISNEPELKAKLEDILSSFGYKLSDAMD